MYSYTRAHHFRDIAREYIIDKIYVPEYVIKNVKIYLENSNRRPTLSNIKKALLKNGSSLYLDDSVLIQKRMTEIFVK